MLTFAELLKNRRAIRDFQDKDVPLKMIEDILQESTLAPSASNGQPCRFTIVKCQKTIKALSDESKANLLDDYAQNKSSLNPAYVDLLKDKNFNVFYNAPCVIYIIGSTSVGSLNFDGALAASYIMFSAVNRGLGTCWIHLGSYIRDPQLKALLGIPDGCRIVAPIIIGYPKEIPSASERHAPEILRVIS
ncbi:MAG: nitroreductase family protein [Smithella sp.]|nr:nitroreductase family protein [Smithella sp.]MDM7987891.1 nitroreductase family protein [Smithella sp.]HOU50268.1 nitroreductase family protein [Smithella sp.]HQG65223.1 nitroreductase family protein [Smithella sp.]HQH16504.1 nitroreductase family protein [Smithella sp.]